MKKIFKIHGLDCANCAQKLEQKINKKIEGVTVSVNFLSEKISIEADDSVFEQKLQEIIKLAQKVEPEAEIKC